MTHPDLKIPMGEADDMSILNDILSFDLSSAERTVARLKSALAERDHRIEKMEAQLKQMQSVLDQFGLDNEK